MAAETGIAIIVCFVPFFFLLYAHLMPESRFSPVLKPLFYLTGLLMLTFTINVATKYAAVEGLLNIRDAMMNTLLWVERLIWAVISFYALSLFVDAVIFLNGVVRQKHG